MPSLTRAQFLALSAAAAMPVHRRAMGAPGPDRPLLMRTIPKSGEKLPAIGLGTARVFADHGDAAAMAAKADVVRTLMEGGGTVIDTAASYEEAEAIVGELVANLGIRAKTFLATKVPPSTPAAAERYMKASFGHLRTDKIDLMQIHNIEDVRLLPVLREWKAKGLLRYVGITHWEPGTQERLASIMAGEELDFVQFNYSVDVRGPEKRLLPLAKDKGIAVIVNVPLGLGSLIAAKRGQSIPPWLQELGCASWAQVLLKFVLSHPAVTVAIPATSKAAHMADNLDAARGPLPDAQQRERLAALWS